MYILSDSGTEVIQLPQQSLAFEDCLRNRAVHRKNRRLPPNMLGQMGGKAWKAAEDILLLHRQGASLSPQWLQIYSTHRVLMLAGKGLDSRSRGRES